MAEQDTGWIPGLIRPLRVPPGSAVDLAKDHDPGARFGLRKKHEGVTLLLRGMQLLAEYQDRLAAQDVYGVLVVLQALDAAGKDGTIKHVMCGVNPQGVHRVQLQSAVRRGTATTTTCGGYARRLPARGKIGIFNRSHYEEVLVVRVHPDPGPGRAPARGRQGLALWSRRYREINDWERYLVDNGIQVVKMFLNLSKEEQRARSWSGSTCRKRTGSSPRADPRERQYWDDYQRAYSDMLSHTSTEWAPWYVLPADHKWFTRVCVAAVIARHADPDRPALSGAQRRGAP